MTQRKITYALSKIKACKEQGFTYESIIRGYQLNMALAKFILSLGSDQEIATHAKMKHVVAELSQQVSVNPNLKMIISKKSVKSLRPWLAKMDAFFKAIKQGLAIETKELESETEKIFALLNISFSKLVVKTKK